MRAIKKLDNYRMYRGDNNLGYYELWYGKYKEGAFCGYISDPRNFETAVHWAEEEIKYEMRMEQQLLQKGN